MIYLYGAGGHAKVVADILECSGITIGGFFDADSRKKLWGYPYFSFPGPFSSAEDQLIISIGDNATRKKIAETYNVKYAIAVHPSAIISLHSNIGEGCVIMGNALINADAVIGNHCIINSNASVDHDCVLGNFVHISPGAVLCGGVTVGDGTQIGAGAIILPGKKIGANTVIGAGTVVNIDIAENNTAVGNPVRVLKKQELPDL